MLARRHVVAVGVLGAILGVLASGCAGASAQPFSSRAGSSAPSAPFSGAVLKTWDTTFVSAAGVAGGQEPLHLGPTGCVMVGDSVLVAPSGSRIADDGRSVHLEGIGDFGADDALPITSVVRATAPDDGVDASIAECGPGDYEFTYVTR